MLVRFAHARDNFCSAGRGFFDGGQGYHKWLDSNTAKLKKWPSVVAIDWDHPDAPDPDFALAYCHLAGMKLDMAELRPEIVKAQDGMKHLYSQAFDEAFAGAGPTLEKIKQLKKDGPKKEHQPGGKDLDIFGLFKGALGAIGELWAYGLQVREASGEHDAELSWGLKNRPASSKGPSWPRHSWPPRAPQAASEGLGLLSALRRSSPSPRIPSRGRGPGAAPDQTHRSRPA